MVVLKQKRRSVLMGLAGLGVGHVLLQSAAEAEGAASQGYVLGPAEGEHLVHFRNPGNIFIKVAPLKGAKNLAIGTQQVPVGAGIPIHIHFEADEAFYILEGSGSFILNDVTLPFEKGGTIFIPKNSWHGFKNPDQELLLLWMVTPTGLHAFFRETCSPSTGRTARRQTDVPRIVCCAVDWVVTLPIREHYRHVGLAEYDSSGVCQTVHYEGVARRDPIPKGSDAPSRRKARDIVTFLDRHGHAEQRSGSILSLIQSPRTCPCGFKISDYYSIDFFIVAFDASDIMIE